MSNEKIGPDARRTIDGDRALMLAEIRPSQGDGSGRSLSATPRISVADFQTGAGGVAPPPRIVSRGRLRRRC